jgi:hypothetical protein
VERALVGGTVHWCLPDRPGALKNNQTAAGSRSETHQAYPASGRC